MKALSSWGLIFSILALLFYKCTHKIRSKYLSKLSALIVDLEVEVIQPSTFFFYSLSLNTPIKPFSRIVFHFIVLVYVSQCFMVTQLLLILYFMWSNISCSHSNYHGNGNLSVYILTTPKFLEVKDCFNFISITEMGI